MRRMIMAILVLLPVMASGQAVTATGTQVPASPGIVEAELTRPGLPVVPELKAALPSRALASASRPASFHESIELRTVEGFTDAALSKAGMLEYGMASEPTEFAAAHISRPAELDLTEAELAGEPAVTTVVLHAVVDENGVARNVSVTQSGGALMDAKAVAAVVRFRFQPATRDNKPAATTVALAIRIAK
jgi:TonB family protein